MTRTYGNGGPNGARVLWPAGLEQLTPAGRVRALERGHWPDDDHIVTRDGQRLYRPVEAARLAALEADHAERSSRSTQ